MVRGAVAGLASAGPELRRKPLTVVLPATGPKVVRPLCVEDGGFSLHAATRAAAEDDVGRTNLFNYLLRPPCWPSRAHHRRYGEPRGATGAAEA